MKSCQAAKFKLSNVPHSQGVCGGASFSSREEVFIRAALSDFATFQFSEILLVFGESAYSSCGRTSVLLHLLCYYQDLALFSTFHLISTPPPLQILFSRQVNLQTLFMMESDLFSNTQYREEFIRTPHYRFSGIFYGNFSLEWECEMLTRNILLISLGASSSLLLVIICGCDECLSGTK